MPRNLELKARLPSIRAARETATGLGAVAAGILRHTDTYFHVPRGRLKLRDFGDGRAELIAYQRPDAPIARLSSYTKVPVEDIAGMREALSESLGISVTVTKTRLLFLLQEARVHIDTVDSLGEFIEFEVPADSDEQSARNTMERLCRWFGVENAQIVSGSYADLLLARDGG